MSCLPWAQQNQCEFSAMAVTAKSKDAVAPEQGYSSQTGSDHMTWPALPTACQFLATTCDF